MIVGKCVEGIREKPGFDGTELLQHRADIASVGDVTFPAAGNQYFDSWFFVFFQKEDAISRNCSPPCGNHSGSTATDHDRTIDILHYFQYTENLTPVKTSKSLIISH